MIDIDTITLNAPTRRTPTVVAYFHGTAIESTSRVPFNVLSVYELKLLLYPHARQLEHVLVTLKE